MRIQRRTFGKLAAGAAAGIAAPAIAQNKPLTIGFSMNLTGPLAPNGKAALLAAQIWEEDINKKGGLLNRPVKLVYYDDQSNPSNIPGLYTKLLDVDKVDVIASSYATNMIAPAMPIVMQHDRTFFSLLGLAVNSEFNYKRYFSMTPTGGPKPKESFTEGFFEIAAEQTPKPMTIAMCGADAEFPRNAMDGARQVVKRLGLKIVYDKTYPPTTTDYTPVVRAMAATNPDIFLACSYPADSVGIIRASHEIGFKPKVYGGGMVGLQATSIKTQLGPLLNGIVVYDFWLRWAGFASDEGRDFVKSMWAIVSTRRPVRIVVGLILLLVGIAGLFLPILQGVAIIIAALAILRKDVPLAERLWQRWVIPLHHRSQQWLHAYRARRIWRRQPKS